MREITVRLFKYSELSEDAQKKARDWWRKITAADPVPWQEETFESLEKLFESLPGVRLANYELGIYCYSFVRPHFTYPEVGELSGPRAMAWLENNLLSSLRIPYTGEKRKRVRKYGSCYYAGKIEPCPFTGYCSDEDFLESLIKDVRSGYTIKEALERLADIYRKRLEDEHEFSQTDEYISDHLSANDYEFTDDGERY